MLQRPLLDAETSVLPGIQKAKDLKKRQGHMGRIILCPFPCQAHANPETANPNDQCQVAKVAIAAAILRVFEAVLLGLSDL